MDELRAFAHVVEQMKACERYTPRTAVTDAIDAMDVGADVKKAARNVTRQVTSVYVTSEQPFEDWLFGVTVMTDGKTPAAQMPDAFVGGLLSPWDQVPKEDFVKGGMRPLLVLWVLDVLNADIPGHVEGRARVLRVLHLTSTSSQPSVPHLLRLAGELLLGQLLSG